MIVLWRILTTMSLFKTFNPYWFLNTILWKSVIRLTPRLIGYPKFRLENYFKIREILRNDPEGIYCFVGCDNKSVALKLQRIFHKIWWGHSGFVELGADNEVYISHVRKRLRYDSLLYYLKEVDNFALLKLPLKEEEKEIVKAKIKKLHNSKCYYQVRANLSILDQYASDSYWKENEIFYFYCSEYQYFVCMNLMNPNWKRGKTRFTADELYKNSKVVFEE